MAKFGQRMPARQLANARYGKNFVKMAKDARDKATAIGHDFPEPADWTYDGQTLGHYAATCRTCGMSAIVRFDEKEESRRLVGQVLTICCPGRPWL